MKRDMSADIKKVKKLWGTVGSKRPLMFLSLFLGFVGMLADSIGFSLGLAQVTDAVLAKDLAALGRAQVMLVSFLLTRTVCNALKHYVTAQGVEEAVSNMRRKLFKKALGGHTTYFDAHESGDLISRLNNDAETAKGGIRTLMVGANQIFLILATFTGLFVWSWPFAVGIIVLAGLAFAGGASVAGPVKRTSERYQQTLASVSESATNFFGGVAVIKSLGAKGRIEKRFDTVVSDHEKAGKARGLSIGLQQGIGVLTPFLGLTGLIMLGGTMALKGILSVGSVLGLVQLSSRALFPFSELGSLWAQIQQSLAAFERVLEACDIPQEEMTPLPDRAHKMADRSCPVIEFQDVHFAYKGEEAPVLNGLSFQIPRGCSAAILGPSGVGKTTIFRLIMGLYEPTQGRVLLEGEDLSQLPLSYVRDKVALLPQEPWLSPGTIKENILMGRPLASQSEVEYASELAQAAGFINELTDGYDTEVRDDLSGGERQRICLARAFLKEAPILLLDEPTSAVDAESQRLIKQAVDSLSADRTVLTIAHGETMVENADVTVKLSLTDL